MLKTLVVQRSSCVIKQKSGRPLVQKKFPHGIFFFTVSLYCNGCHVVELVNRLANVIRQLFHVSVSRSEFAYPLPDKKVD